VIDGVNLGDVWPCTALALIHKDMIEKGEKHVLFDGDAIGLLPLHKLSQWLTYSIIEVFEKCLDVEYV
jgi:hypothetical protein